MSTTPGALLEFASVEVDKEASFEAWQASERTPLFRSLPGLTSFRRLREVETPARRLLLAEVTEAETLLKAPALQSPVLSGSGVAVAAPATIQTLAYRQLLPSADTPPRPEEGKYLFLVAVDVRAEMRSEFNDWYNTDHVPNLLRTDHIHRARRFETLGAGPQYLTMYDVSATVPVDEAGRAITGTFWSKRVIPRFTLRIREVYLDEGA